MPSIGIYLDIAPKSEKIEEKRQKNMCFRIKWNVRITEFGAWWVFVEWAELIVAAPREESLLVCSLLVLARQFYFACAYVRAFVCMFVRSCVRVCGSRVRAFACMRVCACACVFPQCYWFFAVTSVTAMKKMEKNRVWIQRCASKIRGLCRGSSCCHSVAKRLWQLIWVGCVCNLLK